MEIETDQEIERAVPSERQAPTTEGTLGPSVDDPMTCLQNIVP